ncbi:hypothetical protein SynA1528_02359 [Synechococcus sp. A15-28]|nr:hypothetical protein SynA1528_02359 [Synechococcus sp. A15-28]
MFRFIIRTSKYKLAGNFIAIDPTFLLNYINICQNMQRT